MSMTEEQIAVALRTRLAATPSASPIVWGANASGVWDAAALQYVTPEPPFWLAYQVKTPPERMGVGDWHIYVGRLVVAVMVTEGTFEGESSAQAQRIIDQFPPNMILTAGDGQVQITAIGYADDGAPDGAYFRTNVHIRYLAME
jgi:hypothetical protein